MSKDKLKAKLKIVDQRFLVKLEEIQISMDHKSNRGSNAEEVLRVFLREYLTDDKRVGEGEIIDTNNNTTTQLDVVVTNRYHPYINDLLGPELFIIEGVDVVGEVKTNLNSNDISVLIESCKRFKKLTSKFSNGTTICTNTSDRKRYLEHKPYFIFAYKSQLTIETIYSKLVEYYEKNGTPVEEQIDAVFCLDRGVIINFGDGKGAYQYIVGEQSIPGLIITKREEGEILLNLLTWLSISIINYQTYQSPLIQYLLG